MTEFPSERPGDDNIDFSEHDFGDIESLWSEDPAEMQPVTAPECSAAHLVAKHAFDTGAAEATATTWDKSAPDLSMWDDETMLEFAPRSDELVMAGATAAASPVATYAVLSPTATDLWNSGFDTTVALPTVMSPTVMSPTVASPTMTSNPRSSQANLSPLSAGHAITDQASTPVHASSHPAGSNAASSWSFDASSERTADPSEVQWSQGATWGDAASAPAPSGASPAWPSSGPGRTPVGTNSTTILSHAVADSTPTYPPGAVDLLGTGMRTKSDGRPPVGDQTEESPEYTVERRGPRPLLIAACAVVAGLVATMLWTILGSNRATGPSPTLLPSTPVATSVAELVPTTIAVPAVEPTPAVEPPAPTAEAPAPTEETQPAATETGNDLFGEPVDEVLVADELTAATPPPADAQAPTELGLTDDATVQFVPDGAPAPAP